MSILRRRGLQVGMKYHIKGRGHYINELPEGDYVIRGLSGESCLMFKVNVTGWHQFAEYVFTPIKDCRFRFSKKFKKGDRVKIAEGYEATYFGFVWVVVAVNSGVAWIQMEDDDGENRFEHVINLEMV